MATDCKHSVVWSPTHEDRFLMFTNDLFLYKVEPTKDTTKNQSIKLCDEYQGTLLATNSDHQYIKCLAWYPKAPPENLIAVGLATGKVVLTSFGKSSSDSQGLVGRELIPKHGRQCHYLTWNPVLTNLIAEGLDKHRQDNSIQIWDLNQKSESLTHTKPAFEFGHNEPTSSLAWFRATPKSLVTGINTRFLRIYDLRDISRPRCSAYTKGIHGVEVDPHNDNRIVSYMEGQVLVWDTRHFDKPVLTLPQKKSVAKLSWSKTRNNLLACLPKESNVIKLYDIQYTHGVSEDLEPAVVERIVQPYKQQTIAGYDWHPTHENKLLTISATSQVKQVKVFEKIAVTWSPDIYLSWGCGRQLLQVHSVKLCREANEDIALKMKRRAQRGYGLQEDISKNGSLTDDPQLMNLWSWLAYAKAKLKEELVQKKINALPRVQGIKSILKYDAASQKQQLQQQQQQQPSSSSSSTPAASPASTSPVAQPSQPNRSALEFLSWQLTDGHRLRSQRKVYRSEDRLRALVFCGWGPDRETHSMPYIDQIESKHEYERAAAIAVFTLRMGRAIDVLNAGAQHRQQGNGSTDLNIVAMALSGYYDDKNTLWKDMCSSLKSKLSNAYLRAMFSFLTCQEDDYDFILGEEDMAVIDRVAFACMYLPDTQLQEFVCDLCKKLTEKGHMDGILLTGLSVECVDLLQKYVDVTADVQTAALTVVHALTHPDLAKDQRVNVWIESYRELLDVWRLWHHRAEFDVYRNMLDMTVRVQPQVCACCNFCGKSIGYNSSSSRNRGAFMFTASGAVRSRSVSLSAPMHNTSKGYGSHCTGPMNNMAKITSCAGCRKPLPRCTLCLINMGTAAGNQQHRHANMRHAIEDSKEKLTVFSDWFTWCQTCRHGGHADHLTQWFKENKECPVTGCDCRCTSLDSVNSVSSYTQSATDAAEQLNTCS